MSVYIHGVQMPKNFPLIVHANGDVYYLNELVGQAVEIPAHGRLGDLDALTDE